MFHDPLVSCLCVPSNLADEDFFILAIGGKGEKLEYVRGIDPPFSRTAVKQFLMPLNYLEHMTLSHFHYF